MWDTILLVLGTAVATCILTILLTPSFVRDSVATSCPATKPIPTKESRPADDPSPPKYPGLYRAQGIPSTYSKASTKQLLSSILGCDDSSLVVHCLADDPRGKPTKIAAFTLAGGSTYLSGRARRWTFELPKEQQPSGKGQSDRMQISIDDHFEGFTPLNSFESSKEHKLE